MHASASTSRPSVLAQPAELMHSPLDSFGSTTAHERSDSASRRQRISMACQYCRHRKIRCCGGSPCRNCTRSHRECEYAPVPEEVNRATREKKAVAKAAKTSHYGVSPVTTYSPFFADTPVFELPYVQATSMRPTHLGHRRSVSVPNFDASPWVQPPPAPMLHSPAMFESSQWMYNGWSTGPPVPQMGTFPSVLEHVPEPQPQHQHHHQHSQHQHSHHQQQQHYQQQQQPTYYHPATPPDSQSSSEVDLPVSWSTPNLHLRVPALTPGQPRTTPHSPVTPIYYSPHPTPPLYHHSQQPLFSPSPLGQVGQPINTSPTLAPEMQLPTKELVGLGIGIQEAEMIHTPTYLPDEYMSAGQF